MKSKKKIVLFNPRTHPDDYNRNLPLPLLVIASLIHKEYNVKITYDVPNVDYHRKILELCEDALCLGISAMTGYQIKDGLRLCKMVREKYPGLPIIWGGYHATILPKQTLESPFVDIIVIGHGRRAFYELVKALDKKKPLDSIKGIAYKQKGKMHFNKRGEFEDPNDFPEIPYYLIKERLKRQKSVEYATSFGCPYNCGFCAENIMSQRKWKGLKAERVVKEIKKLAEEYEVKEFIITDSNFFVDKQRFVRICKGLIKEKLNIKYDVGGGRVDTLLRLNPEEWKLLKESGCNLILIGAESGDQSILDLVNKGIKVEDTEKVIRLAARYDIPLNLSCMVGLPDTDIYESLYRTMDLMDVSLKATDKNELQILLYTPYAGSPLYELSKKFGFKEPKSLEEWSTFELNTKNTPWVSKKDAEMIEMIHRWYIIPFLTGIYEKAVFDKVKHFKFITDFVYFIYYNLAKLRWDHRFFRFPVEYQFIKLVKSYLKQKRGFND